MKNIWALSFLFVSVMSIVLPSTSGNAVQAQQQQALPKIADIRVIGNIRVEGATILQFMTVRAGDDFNPVTLNESLKRLYSTGFFSDIKFERQGNILIIRVQESPIINRVIFEGNKKLDNEDLAEETRLRPRDVFTRAKVKAEVSRMLELYRSKGRFAAIIEPKVVQQEQNRVDVVFEIQEGPKTKVSKINFLGNKIFSDGDLRDVLATKESRWWKIFSSGDTYDPDKIIYDQQQLRQFYLNEGYADFRIVSAVAELTPDRSNFIINYTLEEGEQYKFGKIDVESQIRDVNANFFKLYLRTREGNVYSREAIEKSEEALTDLAGAQGYAFVDVRTSPKRNRKDKTIELKYVIQEAPRVYVERINISGNMRTLDKVIRREFRLQEGDAFNSFLVKRSEDRLKRLGFFRPEGIEVERRQGTQPDRMVVDVNVEEQATGDLQFGVGFSSVENFIFNFSISERNFMGKGQNLGFALNLSGQQQSANISFTEPYFLNRTISAGGDIFVRRTDSSRFGAFLDSDSLGFSLRAGAALGEYWSLQTNYTLRLDDVSLAQNQIDLSLGLRARDPDSFFRTTAYTLAQLEGFLADAVAAEDEDAIAAAERRIEYFNLSDAAREEVYRTQFGLDDPVFNSSIGKFTQSIIGYTLGFDTRNNFLRPTAGRSFFFSQNFAGLGGDVRYIRSSLNFDNYWTPIPGWTLRLSAQGSWIKGLGQDVRLNDSFFLGGPQLRGFDVSSVGPRRFQEASLGIDVDGGSQRLGQSLGGTKQYIGRAEVFFPLGDAALEMGINASAFLDVGSLWDTDIDLPSCRFGEAIVRNYQNGGGSFFDRPAFEGLTPDQILPEHGCVIGDSWKPRATVGIGFSWQSPFGPFRIDLTKALRKQFGDRTQSLQFNIGTQF